MNGKAANIARNYRNDDSSDFEDLVQEAAIASWLEGREGAYDTAVMRNKIVSLLAGRSPMFGNKGENPIFEPMRRRESLLMGDDADLLFGEIEDDFELTVDRSVQVNAAIEGLTKEDRLLIEGRFWGGKTMPELAVEMGVKRATLEDRWLRRIKPALRKALA